MLIRYILCSWVLFWLVKMAFKGFKAIQSEHPNVTGRRTHKLTFIRWSLLSFINGHTGVQMIKCNSDKVNVLLINVCKSREYLEMLTCFSLKCSSVLTNFYLNLAWYKLVLKVTLKYKTNIGVMMLVFIVWMHTKCIKICKL